MVFSFYDVAVATARQLASAHQRPYGIERAREYGKDVWRVKMLPKDPRKRFGWELRCEVVEPEIKA